LKRHAMTKTLLKPAASKHISISSAVSGIYASKKHQNLPDDDEEYEEMDTYYSSEEEDDDSDTGEPRLESLDDLDDDDDLFDEEDDY
jgi:hypothetical protein